MSAVDVSPTPYALMGNSRARWRAWARSSLRRPWKGETVRPDKPRSVGAPTSSPPMAPSTDGCSLMLLPARVNRTPGTQPSLLGTILLTFTDTQGDSMTEIITALIGGVFLLGGAVITARWTRSRSTGNQAPAALPPTSNPQPDGVTTNAPSPLTTHSRTAPLPIPLTPS